ncbi:RNA methyltransferase [Knoellia sinensis KCTC 19936]|uniref:RNA methyltransferase n=1 Tax=Knoellia sinensis KCTC 19936 TaxID=1385520 RepID=A0A0A0JBQ1_9MICO|nr:TfoX/Sxy family protein [Knoellia sinensis]KGN34244.1 RNA methyltransferase [Knoellia sinensis KCTC 19936]
MAYDEVLADRIREVLAEVDGVTERKMFGGLGFMVHGHMAAAAASEGALMVRVDPAAGAEWVDGESVRPMEMGNRTLNGWLLVARDELEDDSSLRTWVSRGVAFVQALPPK